MNENRSELDALARQPGWLPIACIRALAGSDPMLQHILATDEDDLATRLGLVIERANRDFAAVETARERMTVTMQAARVAGGEMKQIEEKLREWHDVTKAAENVLPDYACTVDAPGELAAACASLRSVGDWLEERSKYYGGRNRFKRVPRQFRLVRLGEVFAAMTGRQPAARWPCIPENAKPQHTHWLWTRFLRVALGGNEQGLDDALRGVKRELKVHMAVIRRIAMCAEDIRNGSPEKRRVTAAEFQSFAVGDGFCELSSKV